MKCHIRKCKSFKRNKFELKTFFANSQRELEDTDLSSYKNFFMASVKGLLVVIGDYA